MVAEHISGTPKKVSFIFFKSLFHKLPKEFKVSFQDDLHFSVDVPKVEDPLWQQWIGLDWESVTKANAVLKAETPTSTPDILDGENQLLDKLCTRAWIALKLTGPFSVEGVRFATGSEVSDKLHIRQTHSDRWISCGRPFMRPIVIEDVSLWVKLFLGLGPIHEQLGQGSFQRLNKGLLCFQKACDEMYEDFRLPMFVRALEALVLPDKGETTKQFVQRAVTWWPKEFGSKGVDTALREIYDMRCDFDHLHGLKDQYSQAQLQRAYQAEALARNALQSVILNPSKRERFVSDEKIRAYWQRPIRVEP